MKKMRMCFPKEKTFADGFAEYILDCKSRNLRDGTINHYQESIKQIYKRIPPDIMPFGTTATNGDWSRLAFIGSGIHSQRSGPQWAVLW